MARVNLPPLTRSLLISLIAFTLLNAIIRPTYTGLTPFLSSTGSGSPYLSIVPQHSWKYPYTFVTASFVEQNVFGLLVSGLTLFYGGRYLERAWGSREYALFILIVGVLPNVLAWGLYMVLYSVSGSGEALNTTISGSIALQSAFLVSFKQLVPEHTVSLARGLLRMRVKHFPALHLAANTISGILLGTETAMFLSWFAFFVAWTYLRFYRRSSLDGVSGDTVRGDASDTFAFAYFFPEPVHTPVSIVADNVYQILVGLKILAPFSADDVETGNEQALARAEGGLPSIMSARGGAGGGGGGGSGRREEAERRRALALRALDQRLRQGTSPGPASAAPAIVVPAPAVAEEASSGGGGGGGGATATAPETEVKAAA